MRWLVQCWRAAERAGLRGARVEAVTAWALLGAHDWDRLVTTDSGSYECGVYDLRGGNPRPTAMVPLLRALSAGIEPPHGALLSLPGWWERDIRLWPGLRHPSPSASVRRLAGRGGAPRGPEARPILVTGKSGTLGQMFSYLCGVRGLPHVLTDRQALTIDDPASVAQALERFRPAAVINAAGLVDIDRAEAEPGLCLSANAEGPANLARACAAQGIPLVTFSSDQVFDGTKGSPYVEGDAPAPLNAYGRSKAEAERRVLDIHSEALVIRTAAFFSPHDPHNFAVNVLDALHRGRSFAAVHDSHVSPTYVPDLVDTVLDLLLDGEAGIRHLASNGRLSWAECARRLAAAEGLDPGAVEAVGAASLGWRAPRPKDVALGTERGPVLPSVDHAITPASCAITPGLPRRCRQGPAQTPEQARRNPAGACLQSWGAGPALPVASCPVCQRPQRRPSPASCVAIVSAASVAPAALKCESAA